MDRKDRIEGAPVMAISPANVLFWVTDMNQNWVTVTQYEEGWHWDVPRSDFPRWKLFRCAEKKE